MAIYLDCAASMPVDPRVTARVMEVLADECGNAGSRGHELGRRARRRVEQAREQVARVVDAGRAEVVFTSGATESSNLAILGLAEYGRQSGRRHAVSTRIEHRAVLEPLEQLRRHGFEISLVAPEPGGWVDPEAVRGAVRPETLLVSVMHVNNETGIIQPIAEIAELLGEHSAYFHVDAAQGFGRELQGLRHPRVDLVSISGHKIHAPQGIGALVTRRREGRRPPLAPLLHGGGQEFGLRPGTLPVALISGLGLAAELAVEEGEARAAKCRQLRERLLRALAPLEPVVNGDPGRGVPHILNLSIPGVLAEEALEALDGLIAVSDGAACSSQADTCSHVLSAMGLDAARIEGALRFSWCHLTEEPEWNAVVHRLSQVRVRQEDCE